MNVLPATLSYATTLFTAALTNYAALRRQTMNHAPDASRHALSLRRQQSFTAFTTTINDAP